VTESITSHVAGHDGVPAPQPGDVDHYRTFLDRICHFYGERFSDLDNLPAVEALTIEDALLKLSADYPELLPAIGQWAFDEDLPGAAELDAVLRSVQTGVHGEPPEVEKEV